MTDFGPPVPLGPSYAMVTDWRTCVSHFAGCACQQERMRLLGEVARTAQGHLDAALEPEPFDVRWAERYQAAALAVRDALAALAAFDQGVRS